MDAYRAVLLEGAGTADIAGALTVLALVTQATSAAGLVRFRDAERKTTWA